MDGGMSTAVADRCARCSGLTVTEQVFTEPRMQPLAESEMKQKWHLGKEEVATMVRFQLLQRRCLNCGGVSYLT